MKKGDMTIDIQYDGDERLVIARDAITGLRGNADGTTIYFHGNTVTVRNPLKEILSMLHVSIPQTDRPAAVSSQ